MALLISALPMTAFANAGIALDKGDFVAAKALTRDGETIVSVKLSKSGKAKFKKLNRESAKSNALEMGPYTPAQAQEIVRTINNK